MLHTFSLYERCICCNISINRTRFRRIVSKKKKKQIAHKYEEGFSPWHILTLDDPMTFYFPATTSCASECDIWQSLLSKPTGFNYRSQHCSQCTAGNENSKSCTIIGITPWRRLSFQKLWSFDWGCVIHLLQGVMPSVSNCWSSIPFWDVPKCSPL